MILRKHKIIYIIYCLFVLAVSLFTLFKTNSYTGTIIAIATIPVAAIVLQFMGIFALNKVSKFLANIQIDESIAESKRLLDDCISDKYKDHLYLILSQCYFIKGNTELSKKYLSKYKNPQQIKGRILYANKFVYYKRSILELLMEDNPEETSSYLDGYENLLKSFEREKHIKKSDVPLFADTYTSLKYQIEIARISKSAEDDAGVNSNMKIYEEFFSTQKEKTTIPLAKLYSTYLLAKIHTIVAETDKANAEFDYVIQNGTGTIYATDAVQQRAI